MSRNLGKQLKLLRNKAGLTQNQLAEKANTSNNQISKYELSDACPTVDSLIPIAKALNCNLAFIDVNGAVHYID